MRKDLYDALKCIRDYCADMVTCKDCEISEYCFELEDDCPKNWDLKEEQ